MKNKKWNYLSLRSMAYIGGVLICILGMQITLTVIILSKKMQPLYILPGYILLGILIIVWYKWLYRPYQEMNKVWALFSQGYMFQGIFDSTMYISPEFELAFQRLQDSIDTNELISASKKQAEYLALQNQINPHFLYNTLEGIRGETLSAGLVNVAKMTEALATFFRYTISKVDHLVTLEDEIKNIENYYIIQQYRFGERLSLSVEYSEEEEIDVLQCKLPKLTLQPIVENSIYHGIERKIGKGNLKIKIEVTKKRLIITISDDGLGMAPERLQEINNKLHNLSMDYVSENSEAKGGIAIVNVNSRIKLLFGEEYGICIYSVLNLGTDVEITLPVIVEEEKDHSWKKY
ncbi:MAG: histidine kinase [Lachnospiraceae bacterium]